MFVRLPFRILGSVPADVVIYTTGYCPYCHMAKDLLSDKGVQFREVLVENRPDLRAFLRQKSGQGTVPQVFVNGESLGGYSDISALDRRGELDGKLAREPQAGDPALQF